MVKKELSEHIENHKTKNKSSKEPDPFALEVANNEYFEAVHEMECDGKRVHRIEVVQGGYILRFYIPSESSKLEHLIDLILDYPQISANSEEYENSVNQEIRDCC